MLSLWLRRPSLNTRASTTATPMMSTATLLSSYTRVLLCHSSQQQNREQQQHQNKKSEKSEPVAVVAMTPALALRVLGLSTASPRGGGRSSSSLPHPPNSSSKAPPITLGDVKAAYKRRVLEIHPDVLAGGSGGGTTTTPSPTPSSSPPQYTFHQLQEALAMATRTLKKHGSGDGTTTGGKGRWAGGKGGSSGRRYGIDEEYGADGDTLEAQVSDVVQTYTSLASAFHHKGSSSGSKQGDFHAVTDACHDERRSMQVLHECTGSLPKILSRGGGGGIGGGGVPQYVLFDTFPLYHPLYTAAMSKAIERFNRDLPYIARRVVKARGGGSSMPQSPSSWASASLLSSSQKTTNTKTSSSSASKSLVNRNVHGSTTRVVEYRDKEREHRLEISRRMDFARAFKFATSRTGNALDAPAQDLHNSETSSPTLSANNHYASEVVAQELHRLGYDHETAVNNKHQSAYGGGSSKSSGRGGATTTTTLPQPDFKINVFADLRERTMLASEQPSSSSSKSDRPAKDPTASCWWWSDVQLMSSSSSVASHVFKRFSTHNKTSSTGRGKEDDTKVDGGTASVSKSLVQSARDLLARRNAGNLCDMISVSQHAIESKPLKPLVFVGALIFGHIGSSADHPSLATTSSSNPSSTEDGSSGGDVSSSAMTFPPRSMGPQSVEDVRCAPELKCLLRCARFNAPSPSLESHTSFSSSSSSSGDSVDTVASKLAQWEQNSTKRLAVELAAHDQCTALSGLLLSPSVTLSSEVSTNTASNRLIEQHSPHLAALYSVIHHRPSVSGSFRVAPLTIRQQLHCDAIDAVSANLTLRRLEFLLGGIVDSYAINAFTTGIDETSEDCDNSIQQSSNDGVEDDTEDAEAVLRKMVAEITVLQACGAVADAIGGSHPEILLTWEAPTTTSTTDDGKMGSGNKNSSSSSPGKTIPFSAAHNDKILKSLLTDMDEKLKSNTTNNKSNNREEGNKKEANVAPASAAAPVVWGPEWCSPLITSIREVFQVTPTAASSGDDNEGEYDDDGQHKYGGNSSPAAASDRYRALLQKLHSMDTPSTTSATTISPTEVLEAVGAEVMAREEDAYHHITREEIRLEREYQQAIRNYATRLDVDEVSDEVVDDAKNEKSAETPKILQNPKEFISTRFLHQPPISTTKGNNNDYKIYTEDDDAAATKDCLNPTEAEEARATKRAASSYFTVRRIPNGNCSDLTAKPQFEVCVHIHKNPVRFLRSLLLAQREVVRRAVLYNQSILPALGELQQKLDAAEFVPIPSPSTSNDTANDSPIDPAPASPPPSESVYVSKEALSSADHLSKATKAGRTVSTESMTSHFSSTMSNDPHYFHHLHADGTLGSFPLEGSLEEERLIAKLVFERISSQQCSDMSYRNAQRRTGLLRGNIGGASNVGSAGGGGSVPHPQPVSAVEAERIQLEVRDELQQRRRDAILQQQRGAAAPSPTDTAEATSIPQSERASLHAHVSNILGAAKSLGQQVSSATSSPPNTVGGTGAHVSGGGGKGSASGAPLASKHTKDSDTGLVVQNVASSTKKKRTSGFHRSMLAAETTYEIRGTHDVGDDPRSNSASNNGGNDGGGSSLNYDDEVGEGLVDSDLRAHVLPTLDEVLESEETENAKPIPLIKRPTSTTTSSTSNDDVLDGTDPSIDHTVEVERESQQLQPSLPSNVVFATHQRAAPVVTPPRPPPPPPPPPSLSVAKVGVDGSVMPVVKKYVKKKTTLYTAIPTPPSESPNASASVDSSPQPASTPPSTSTEPRLWDAAADNVDVTTTTDMMTTTLPGTTSFIPNTVPAGYMYRPPVQLISSTHGFEDPKLLLGFYTLLHHHRVEVAKVEQSMSIAALSAQRHQSAGDISTGKGGGLTAALTRSAGWVVYGNTMPPGCGVLPSVDRADMDTMNNPEDGDGEGGQSSSSSSSSLISGWYGDTVSSNQLRTLSSTGAVTLTSSEQHGSGTTSSPTSGGLNGTETEHRAPPASLSHTHEDLVVITKSTIFKRSRNKNNDVLEDRVGEGGEEGPLASYTLNHDAFLRWLRAVSAASHLFAAARRIIVKEGLWYVVRDQTGVMDDEVSHTDGDDDQHPDMHKYTIRSGPLSPRKFLSFLTVFRHATTARAVLEQRAVRTHHSHVANQVQKGGATPSTTCPIMLTPETVGFVLVVSESVTSISDGRLYVPWNADPSVLVSLLHANNNSDDDNVAEQQQLQ